MQPDTSRNQQRRPRRPLPAGAGGDREPRAGPERGGLRDPVHAGREPGQMAPRAHDVVLRDLRARAEPARLPAVRPGVPRAVQFVLQRGRREAPAAGARHAVAPGLDEVLAYRRHVDAAMHQLLAGATAARRTVGPGRPGHAPRAAAPGTDPHRPEAPAVAQSAAAGVPEALAAHAGPRARARLDLLRRRSCRKSGTRATASASTTRRRGIASGWNPSASPRIRSRTAISSSSSRTAATAARAVALRRMGHGQRARLAGARLLGTP